jgi:predicted nucleic acid-binding protein
VIVVDANIIVYCVIDSSHSGHARRVAQKDPKWILPPLWQYEVTSSVLKLVRSRALTRDQAAAAIADAATLVAGREVAVDQARALQTAIALGLSAYDAQYITLALAYGLHCITGDGPLLKKAPEVALSPSQFIQE